MEAGDLGERELIDLIWRSLREGHPDRIGRNQLPHPDDAAAIRLPDGSYLVLKTDMFVKRTDAPKGMRHFQMGAKCVVMNASDLAAKGARPFAFMHSLGIPRRYSKERVLSLVDGILSACDEYQLEFLGGDLGESSDLIIAGFMAGLARRLVRRSGASPGDLLAVTGPFGDTACAFKILIEGKAAPQRLKRSVIRSIYAPKARVGAGVALAESGAVTACMDSSDGLAFTIGELSRSSNVGFELSKIPVSDAAKEFSSIHGIPAEELALYGGEEYELVLTIRPEMLAEAQRASGSAGAQLTVIGRAVEGAGVYFADGNGRRPIPLRGYEHFKG